MTAQAPHTELRAADVERAVGDLQRDKPFVPGVLADQPVEVVGSCGRCP